MTERQQRIWSYLETFHRGRDHGVRHQPLADHLGIPQRRVREAINILVCEHDKPIGSHPRYGVFVCSEAEDYELARQCLADEVWPTLQRQKILKRLSGIGVKQAAVTTSQISLFDVV